MTSFITTREIGIDMGHRVTNHGSKCRSVHGHRYKIAAEVAGELEIVGSSEGMVIDFGFLKEEMMDAIDAPCDHALCLWSRDPLLTDWAVSSTDTALAEHYGGAASQWIGGKLYILATVPTAENLAKHWFEVLEPRVTGRTQGRARLERIIVWETPNCLAEYRRPESR
jgi:6-pyruvoyltetrahydropterin/6-carboxytetrahydropterin synthase